MSKLDKKLLEILLGPTSTDEAVELVKQAFADEGYVHVPQVEVVTRWESGNKPELFMVNGSEVLTGQEWYDKFKKGLGGGEHLLRDEVLYSARKAANLDD